MNSEVLLVVLLGVVTVVVALPFILVYNMGRLTKNELEQIWADVGVLLQRRDALIPKLIAMTEQTLTHERTTLEGVIQARTNAHQAPDRLARMRAEDAVGIAVNRFLAVVENYPQLTATENFKPVQQELIRTENDIASRREAYNDAVRRNNDFVVVFPLNLFASVFKFAKEQYL